MKADQERVRALLTDTITLLCRNGLHFQKQLRVEGLLGITVDDGDVFLVHVNEIFSDPVSDVRNGFEDQLGTYISPLALHTVHSIAAETLSKSQMGMCETNAQNLYKHKNDGSSKTPASKRQKSDSSVQPTVGSAGVQYSRGSVMTNATSHTNNLPEPNNLRIIKEEQHQQQHQPSVQPSNSASSALSIHWSTTFPKARQPADQHARNTELSQQYYSHFGNDSNGKQKTNTNSFAPLGVLSVPFAAGIAMATADYSSISRVAGCELIAHADGSHQTDNKAWTLDNNQQQQNQQLSQTTTNDRLIFDPMANCTQWATHLNTAGLLQGLLQPEDQTANSSIISANQLGVLNSFANDTENFSDLANQRGSKESRRSWTSKHKPHTCDHPRCQRSYFFVHDLRRHLRQKHKGKNFSGVNEGKFEVIAHDDSSSHIAGDPDNQNGNLSPLSANDSDDQSRDSVDHDEFIKTCSNLQTS